MNSSQASTASSWFGADAGICWIHPEPSPPAAPPDGGACGCYNGQNDYCGLSIVNRAWWYGCRPGVALSVADYDDLSACDGGVFTFKQSCSAGCISRTMTNNTGYCR
ncbi:MAG: hypothetical protein JNJ54_30760 [Myxococcaceae bacterium]|nr:hypothetical protein [Myxococcaceae bacterium]